MAITAVGESQSFAYTGNIQEFVVPVTGYYALTCVGGNGNCYEKVAGGKGGTTVAYEYLKEGTTIYVVVGGGGGQGYSHASASVSASGGYNGGGSIRQSTSDHHRYGGGGGATHIATETGLLSALSGNTEAVLTVAGGGGGGYYAQGGTYYYGEGGNGPGGGSFGQGGTQGGGGYNGGSTRKGGTGYVKTTEALTINGATYTPTITRGSGYVQGGNGLATITLLAEVASITAYLGDIPVEAMFAGDLAVESIL